MKRIVFITAFTPSRFSAGQNFTLQTLHALADHYVIDLVYFKYKIQEYVPDHRNISVLKAINVSRLSKMVSALSVPFLHPFFTVRFSLPLLVYLFRLTRKHEYDMIYFDFSQVFVYSLFVRAKRNVLMCHDVIFQKFLRRKKRAEVWWVRVSEGLILRRPNRLLLVFSKKDANILLNRYGVESTIVSFHIHDAITKIDFEALSHKRQFCFFAAWNRTENSSGLLWFLKHVVVLVPDEQFVIIGPGLNGEVARMAMTYANVKYLGFLENPYTAVAESSALIAPLFAGAGVKVKVIESLACGIPVFGTPVALEGIEAPSEDNFVSCCTAQDFVDAIRDAKITPQEKQANQVTFLAAYKGKSVNDILTGNGS